MRVPILPSKLYIPPPRHNLVERTKLLDRLDGGLRAGRCLSIVAAPAGFGKTTLITSWIYSATRAASSRAVAWLSLDEADGELTRFLAHLVKAFQQIDPSVGRTAMTLLGTPQMLDTRSLGAGLVRDIAAIAEPLLLVLDDLHLVQGPDVHALLRALLDQPLPRMHVVLLTRELPAFPLSRMRVRDEVTEIDAEDLRFSLAETTAFLRQTVTHPITEETAILIAERTEGWAAGVQLLALALDRRGDWEPATKTEQRLLSARLAGDTSLVEAAPSAVDTVATANVVADYIAVEVLAQESAATRAFLRKTSILDYLTAPLCDAVTGGDDSAALLARLADANHFLIPLDARDIWYRYHRLFAEALRSGLSAEEEAGLRLRAAGWYEDQGMLDRAVSHALVVGRLTGDQSAAEALIRETAEETARQGEPLAVRGWLEALPEESLRSSAVLATIKGYVLAMTGDLVGADSYSKTAQDLLSSGSPRPYDDHPADPIHLGKVLALRSFVALLKDEDDRAAVGLSERALAVLPEEEVSWRVLALWSRAEAFERLDELSDAIEALREARSVGRTMRETLFTIVAECGLVKLLNDYGRRQEAVLLGRDAAAWYSDAGGEPLPLSGLIYSQLGGLHCEASDLDEAQRLHAQAEALSDRLGLDYELVYARALAAPTWFAVGERKRAIEAIRAGYRQARQGGYADAAWFLAWEANFSLWSGDLASARRWALSEGLSPADRPRLLRIEQHLTYARLLAAEGRLSDARQWLARLAAFAHEHGLGRWLISVNILQASVLDRLGARESALETLARAVRRAEPEGYVRAFLVEGERPLELLRLMHDVSPQFIDRLLAAARSARAGMLGELAGGTDRGPVEPLTDRELEVLQLISRGLSNREIAEHLVIAVGTVKRHANSIYGKLQVHRRTEAVARARELALL